jgi:hypothetical protein
MLHLNSVAVPYDHNNVIRKKLPYKIHISMTHDEGKYILDSIKSYADFSLKLTWELDSVYEHLTTEKLLIDVNYRSSGQITDSTEFISTAERNQFFPNDLESLRHVLIPVSRLLDDISCMLDHQSLFLIDLCGLSLNLRPEYNRMSEISRRFNGDISKDIFLFELTTKETFRRPHNQDPYRFINSMLVNFLIMDQKSEAMHIAFDRIYILSESSTIKDINRDKLLDLFFIEKAILLYEDDLVYLSTFNIPYIIMRHNEQQFVISCSVSTIDQLVRFEHYLETNKSNICLFDDKHMSTLYGCWRDLTSIDVSYVDTRYYFNSILELDSFLLCDSNKSDTMSSSICDINGKCKKISHYSFYKKQIENYRAGTSTPISQQRDKKYHNTHKYEEVIKLLLYQRHSFSQIKTPYISIVNDCDKRMDCSSCYRNFAMKYLGNIGTRSRYKTTIFGIGSITSSTRSLNDLLIYADKSYKNNSVCKRVLNEIDLFLKPITVLESYGFTQVLRKSNSKQNTKKRKVSSYSSLEKSENRVDCSTSAVGNKQSYYLEQDAQLETCENNIDSENKFACNTKSGDNGLTLSDNLNRLNTDQHKINLGATFEDIYIQMCHPQIAKDICEHETERSHPSHIEISNDLDKNKMYRNESQPTSNLVENLKSDLTLETEDPKKFRFVEPLHIIVSEDFLEKMPHALHMLSNNHNIVCIDAPLEVPIAFIVDSFTCVCILDNETALDSSKLKLFVKQLTYASWKFDSMWILACCEYYMNNVLPLIFQSVSQFPCKVSFRQVDDAGFTKQLYHVCKDSYEYAATQMQVVEDKVFPFAEYCKRLELQFLQNLIFSAHCESFL